MTIGKARFYPPWPRSRWAALNCDLSAHWRESPCPPEKVSKESFGGLCRKVPENTRKKKEKKPTKLDLFFLFFRAKIGKKKSQKGVFWGVCKKVHENTRKSQRRKQNPPNWTSWGTFYFFGSFRAFFLQTPQNQRKTKGQQLKSKIVSALFLTFSPRTFSSTQ